MLTSKTMINRVGCPKERSETQGFVKILINAETEKILGGEIVRAITDLMNAGARYTDIQQAMHNHRTVSELTPMMLKDFKPLE